MSATYKRGFAQIRGNFTPMIDMAFLLIVFFVLVSRLVDLESIPMNLPEPESAATVPAGDEQRVVINVLPGPRGRVLGYRVGTLNHPAGDLGLASMRQQLMAMYRTNPGVNVNLRADRSTNFEFVEPVMRVVSEAARNARGTTGVHAARINLVVTQED